MSNDFESLKIIDFDHIEFAVADLVAASKIYFQLGFEKIGERELLERKLKSILLSQNDIYILLSQSQDPSDLAAKYVASHGEGVCNVSFRCEDAVSAFETVTNRGAVATGSPKSFRRDFGEVTQTSIRAFGNVEHTFVSRKGNLFLEGFEIPVTRGALGSGLTRVDHVTVNVETGKMDLWADFYERVFGLKNTRFFDIHTQRTGLYSKVMQSPNGIIKMPFNEPTEGTGKSQIQEFIEIHHGPGVQHVALATDSILDTVRTLRRSVPFLDAPPATYYEAVVSRVPNITEDLAELSELALLVDGDSKGYLLQLFTQNLVGPFFYEVIQRKGNDGFGEGNFAALFESIERDQIRRGVLK